MTFSEGRRRAPERILIYGSFGTGKSFCWVDIAQTHYEAGQLDRTMYAIDTDYGWPKMADEGYGHLEDDGMLVTYHPVDFPELMAASKEISKRAGPGDWVVIDMLSYAWVEAQSYYINNVYGDEPEDYWTTMRAEVVEKGGHDPRSYGGHEGTDWGYITKIYKQFELPLTMKTQAHVLAITEERKLDENRGDEGAKIKQFKPANKMAPVGQKGIGHRFDTIFRMTQRASGGRMLTMVKDRGREGTNKAWDRDDGRSLTIHEPPKAFATSYLVRVAGWSSPSQPKSAKKKSKGKGKKKSQPTTRRRH